MTGSVTLARDYRCAPDGHTIATFRAGETVTGRVAQWAMEDGAARKPPRTPRKPRKPSAQPRPSEIKPAGPDEVM